MPKQFRGTIHFDAPADVVFATQCNPEYVLWKHENMASFDVGVEVVHEEDGAVTIASVRKLPAEIPAAARRFVGDSITVEEVHKWPATNSTGARSGIVRASFGGAPMSVVGTLELRPEGTGSAIDVNITARAHVPLVGGKLEQVVGDQFMRALGREEDLAPRWFAR